MYEQRERAHGARRQAAVLTVALLSVLLVCMQAQAGVDASLERMMGKQAQAAIEAEYPPLPASPLTAYLDRMGQAVVKATGKPGQFNFKVIATEQVNAMALPNGTVYVTTGLLRFVDSPDELAGVICHEIAHVTQHHSLSSFKKQFWAGLGLGVLGLPQTAQTVGQVATTLALLRYSRKDEEEADRLAVRYSVQAGYDPRALREFFRKLAAKEKNKPTGLEVYLSTHPTTEKRVSRVAGMPQLDPENPQAWLAIGDGYLGRRLDWLAAEAYAQAAAHPGLGSTPLLGLARAYLDAGRGDLAVPPAQRALGMAPGDNAAASMLAQARSLPVPRTETCGQAPAALLERLRAAGQVRLTAAKRLEQRRQDLEERQEQIAGRLKEAAQRFSATGSRAAADGASEQVLRDAARTLSALDGLIGRLRVLAKDCADTAQQDQEVATTLAGYLGKPQPRSRLALLQAWTDSFVADSAEGSERSDQALALIAAGADKALEAVRLVSEALDDMQVSASPGWRGTFLAPGSSMEKVERAQALADEARHALAQGERSQAAATLRHYGWKLNLASLALQDSELSRWDGLAAAFFGVTPAEATAARARAGGLGWGVLTLAGVPEGRLPEAPAAKGRGAAPPTGDAESATLLVSLFVRQAERELEARGRLQSGSPASSRPGPGHSPGGRAPAPENEHAPHV